MNAAPHPGRGEATALDQAELARDEQKLAHDLHREHPNPPAKHEHAVQMNYRALTLHGDKLPGRQIKEQAIAAGITNIEVSFHLTLERAGHDVERTIGDDEAWTIHDGDCFTAVKPDDNS